MLAKELLRTTTLSYKQVAQRVDRSRDSVVKFCKEHGIERPTNKMKGHPAWADVPKISPRHVALGLRVTLFRGRSSVAELAGRLGISSYVLRAIEYGIHDITLMQLLKLSAHMGLTLDQLTESHNDRRAP